MKTNYEKKIFWAYRFIYARTGKGWSESESIKYADTKVKEKYTTKK